MPVIFTNSIENVNDIKQECHLTANKSMMVSNINMKYDKSFLNLVSLLNFIFIKCSSFKQLSNM